VATGGRLWSLVHKPTGRELLHRNPNFWPANLALRNAWVAGGVEWNLGTIGHSPEFAMWMIDRNSKWTVSFRRARR
jgi:Domain of unknown function (DUF5107)